MVKPVLVLGLGNPLQGDDGIGCRVIQALEHAVLPEDVEVLDGGTPGLGLVDLLENRRRAIIVDAAEMDELPGTLRRFQPEALELKPVSQFSLHRSGVIDALALAHAMSRPLPDIVFLGVQPAQIGWSEGLSAPVQAALSGIMAAVLREVGADDGQGKNPDY